MRRRERWERPSCILVTILGSYLLSPTARELDPCRGKSTLCYIVACHPLRLLPRRVSAMLGRSRSPRMPCIRLLVIRKSPRNRSKATRPYPSCGWGLVYSYNARRGQFPHARIGIVTEAERGTASSSTRA